MVEDIIHEFHEMEGNPTPTDDPSKGLKYSMKVCLKIKHIHPDKANNPRTSYEELLLPDVSESKVTHRAIIA